MRTANYQLVRKTTDAVVIRDIGPWDKYLSVTNAAEEVVKELLPVLSGRRLFYYDSDDDLSELVIKDGVFVGFAPGGPK